MRKRKNIYINEGIWERAKWLVKYRNTREKTSFDLNDRACILVEQWVEKEMKELKESNPEMFEAIEVTASEKENAAKKLDNVLKKTRLKETLEKNDDED